MFSIHFPSNIGSPTVLYSHLVQMGAMSRLQPIMYIIWSRLFCRTRMCFSLENMVQHLLVFSIMQLGTWADATRLCIMLIGKSEMLPLSVFFIVVYYTRSSGLSKRNNFYIYWNLLTTSSWNRRVVFLITAMDYS